MREKKVTQTTVQRGEVFAPTIWRATITRIVILLLCVFPTWAAIICDCQPEMESRHVYCQTKQPTKLSENNHQNHAGSNGALHCKNTQMPSANFQVRKSSQPAMSCCEAFTQRDLKSAELSPIAPIGAEENNPLPADYRKHISKAPPSINNHPLQLQRPLYLALSCWLI